MNGKSKKRGPKRERTGRETSRAKIEEEGEELEESQKPMLRTKRKTDEVEIPDDGVPYDKGWAWMIVLAGFCNFAIAAGYNRATFVFFVNFLEEFRAPVTETALLYGVKAAINSIVGLFIMNAVVGRFGVRGTVMVGGICLSLSAILGSFATDLTSLILSQAVFHGLGMSMLCMPSTVLLGFYFRRRRSLANSLAKCGVGVGAVAFPPLVTFMLDTYDLRGSLLLMGGVCLHTIVTASLLRPVSFYKKNSATLRLPSGSNAEDPLKLADDACAYDDGTSDSARSSGADDHMAKAVRDDNGTILEDGVTKASGNNGTLILEDTVTNKKLKSRTVHEGSATNNEMSKKGTLPDYNVTNEVLRNDTVPGDQRRNTRPVAEDSIANEKRAENEGRETKRSDKIVLFDKVANGDADDGRSKGIEDGCSHDGSRHGGHVVVNGAEGCSISSRDLLDEKRTFISPDSDGVTTLSKSTSELYCKTPLRPRTYSHREEFSQSSPEGKVSVLDALCQSPVIRYLSTPDVDHDSLCTSQPLDQCVGTEPNTSIAKRTCPGATWAMLRKAAGVLDFSLFYSPMFRMMVVFFFFSPMGQAGPSYLPAMAKERHLDDNQRATLLSIIGGLDFFCRLACGFIADTKVIKVSTMICIALTVQGVVFQLTRLMLTYDLLLVLAVAQGVLGGVAPCVMPILVMEDIGLENTAKAFGFNKLFSGAAMAVFHPLLGYIRDATGSYDAVYNVIGACTFLSAAAIACLSFLPHRLPGHDTEDDAVLHAVEPQR